MVKTKKNIVLKIRRSNKHRSNKRRLNKRRSNKKILLNKRKKTYKKHKKHKKHKGGSLIPQDVVNAGRGLVYSSESLFNNLKGVPINQSPYPIDQPIDN